MARARHFAAELHGLRRGLTVCPRSTRLDRTCSAGSKFMPLPPNGTLRFGARPRGTRFFRSVELGPDTSTITRRTRASPRVLHEFQCLDPHRYREGPSSSLLPVPWLRGGADYEDLTGTVAGPLPLRGARRQRMRRRQDVRARHTAGKFSGSGSFVLSETIGDDENFCDADGSFDIVGGRYTGGRRDDGHPLCPVQREESGDRQLH